MMEHGVKCFGGHARLITDGAEDILKGRQQSWDEKLAEDEKQREAEKAERYREMEIERQESAPIFEYCSRCGGRREVCKNHLHRGDRKCMECGGGVGDVRLRYCINCLDLPYRELREKAIGEPIVYAGEADEED
jgi:hypothetical protein